MTGFARPDNTSICDWREVSCHHCGGNGIVAAYSHNDFLGEKECGRCEGTGRLFVSKRGRLARWPGGPFLGSLGREADHA